MISSPNRLALGVSLGLLALTALVVVASGLQDLAARSTSPEAVVREYFGALERGDAEAALSELAPERRAASRPFVENNLRNEYRISGIAVEQASVLARLAGERAGARSVTVFLDITQAVGGERWQAAPQVPMVEADGRWYLARAPLMDQA